MESSATSEPRPPSPNEPYVFLNCPFDDEYEPLLNAMMLAVLSCGFVPRVANESVLGSLPRIDRICQALHGSRFSIHDLSRCRGEGDENLARFNMPLELGIAMGRQYAALSSPEHAHDWFVLVPDGHTHLKFVSDLAGFDPGTHDETPRAIVPVIMKWLLTIQGSAGFNSGILPTHVIEAIPRLEAVMERLNVGWDGTRPPWIHRVQAVRSIIPTLSPPDEKD
ncbi:MAG: hypothetical protein WBL45_09695 [Solirubrobacterales bacterium]